MSCLSSVKNVKNNREWSGGGGDEFANHDVVGGQKTHTFHMLILPLIPVAILLIQGQTDTAFIPSISFLRNHCGLMYDIGSCDCLTECIFFILIYLT